MPTSYAPPTLPTQLAGAAGEAPVQLWGALQVHVVGSRLGIVPRTIPSPAPSPHCTRPLPALPTTTRPGQPKPPPRSPLAQAAAARPPNIPAGPAVPMQVDQKLASTPRQDRYIVKYASSAAGQKARAGQGIKTEPVPAGKTVEQAVADASKREGVAVAGAGPVEAVHTGAGSGWGAWGMRSEAARVDTEFCALSFPARVVPGPASSSRPPCPPFQPPPRPSAPALPCVRPPPDVEYAELDHPLAVDLAPNDPEYGNGDQWHLPQIGAAKAWDTIISAAGVTVCVIDSGVNYKSVGSWIVRAARAVPAG